MKRSKFKSLIDLNDYFRNEEKDVLLGKINVNIDNDNAERERE